MYEVRSLFLDISKYVHSIYEWETLPYKILR